MKKRFLCLMLLAALLVAGCDNAPPPGTPKPEPQSPGILRVHYIDVGQGDATFIEFPDDRTMLIDAGDVGYGRTVTDYIRAEGYMSLDYIVATHPHADHIGGMTDVLDAMSVGAVYMPRAVAGTTVYESLLDKIDNKGLRINTARAGVNVLADGSLAVDMLAPNSEKYSDLNDYSAVIMITYGDTKFLFMGDAEILSENEIQGDIRADVVKAGHHGSNSSSGQGFVDRVNASHVVISVGKGNSYNHPSSAVFKRWENSGASVYRTDINGTVIISSDGMDIMVAYSEGVVGSADDPAPALPPPGTEDPVPAEMTVKWVLNTNTKKIHYPDCRSVPRINESNRAASDKTVTELVSDGFDACGICKPHD
jgi:competence protein ComEC